MAATQEKYARKTVFTLEGPGEVKNNLTLNHAKFDASPDSISKIANSLGMLCDATVTKMQVVDTDVIKTDK